MKQDEEDELNSVSLLHMARQMRLSMDQSSRSRAGVS